MGDAGIEVKGLKETQDLLIGLAGDFGDLTELHHWLVIASQEVALDDYPTGPPLSALTLAARRRGGSRPIFDTGRLWQSITGGKSGEVAQGPDTRNASTRDWARLGSNLIYAALQNFGGTVRAKNGKYLTIPMSKLASSYDSFPHHFYTGKKLLRMLPLKNKPGYLVAEKPTKKQLKQERKTGVTTRTKAHWLLVESVTIPARRFLPTANELRPAAIDTTQRWIAYRIKQRSKAA